MDDINNNGMNQEPESNQENQNQPSISDNSQVTDDYSQPYDPNNYMDGMPPKEKKGLAIVSLVLGIVSICLSCVFYIGIPCAIVGLILGIICIAKKKSGRGQAIAGIICSSIGLLIGIGIVVATFAIYGSIAEYYGLSVPQLMKEIKNGNITPQEIAEATQEIMTEKAK